MKHFVIISLAVIAVIVIVFVSPALSSKQDEKITAFNNSLKLEENKEYEKAIDEILLVYNENKSNYLLNLRLGWLYYTLADYQTSKKYYSEAAKINPKSIEPLFGLTLPLSALNEWKEVNLAYEQILEIDMNNFTANLRVGQIYLNNGDYSNAKKYLETAYQLFPAEFEPNLSLGWTYYYLGDKLKAKELFTAALMLSKDNKLAAEGMQLVK